VSGDPTGPFSTTIRGLALTVGILILLASWFTESREQEDLRAFLLN
jgi:hypothetical protein